MLWTPAREGLPGDRGLQTHGWGLVSRVTSALYFPLGWLALLKTWAIDILKWGSIVWNHLCQHVVLTAQTLQPPGRQRQEVWVALSAPKSQVVLSPPGPGAAVNLQLAEGQTGLSLTPRSQPWSVQGLCVVCLFVFVVLCFIDRLGSLLLFFSPTWVPPTALPVHCCSGKQERK